MYLKLFFILLLYLNQNYIWASTNDNVSSLIYSAQYKKALKLNASLCQQYSNQLNQQWADCLSMNGVIKVKLGDYQGSEPDFKKALSIRKKLFDKNHLSVANSLNDLGELYRHRGEYHKPELLYQKALSIRLKKLGKQHALTAEIYKNLGELYHDRGEYLKAEQFYNKAIGILNISKNTENKKNELALAEVKTWLAMLYQEQDMLVEAEVLYQLGLAARYRLLGQSHPETLDSVMGLASLYISKGDYELSMSLVLMAKHFLDKSNFNLHPDYARALGLLALIYDYYGENKKAEDNYSQVLQIYLRVYGKHNIMTAYVYSDLGWLFLSKKNYKKSREYFNKALRIRVNTLSTEHQEVADSKKDLANVAMRQGQAQQAEAFLLESLSIYGNTLGENSITKSSVLNQLVKLNWQRGKMQRAVDFMAQAEKIQELEIQRFLVSGSERQKIAYMNTLKNQNDLIVSLHIQGLIKSKSAKKLALNMILRRKGRVIDVLAENNIRKILPKLPEKIKAQVVGWKKLLDL